MKTQSATLANIFNSGSYSRKDTVRLFLPNNTVKNLSRGKVVRDGIEYQDYIRSVGDFVQTGKEVDRLRITCQNVNSELGLLAASDLRHLDKAIVDYGRVYQSNANLSLLEDFPKMFRTVITEPEITRATTSFTLITDFESLRDTVASRGLYPDCAATYKDGINCTSNSGFLTCGKTRFDCIKRGKPWEYLGWEFFEEPTDSAPGTPGNSGGIEPINPGCFGLDTKIKLVAGDVEIGKLPLGQVSIPVYSFNSRTEKIEEDLIIHVHEFEKIGFYELEFESGTLTVTGEHPIFRGFGSFCKVDQWRLADSARFFDNEWRNSRLVRIRWNGDAQIIVRTLTVARNETYFANNCGVHNKPVYQEAQS